MNLTSSLYENVIVTSFKFLPKVDVQWMAFSAAIECPNCKDAKGHAGVFPMEDPSQPPEFGRCVKCSSTILLKTGKQKNQYTLSHKAKKMYWDAEWSSVNLKAMNNTLEQLSLAIQAQIPNAETRARKFLAERQYPEGFINFLIKEGVGWYQPTKQEIGIIQGYPKAPMMQHKPLGESSSKEKFWEMTYRPLPNFSGLLIPIKRDGYIAGFTVRNGDAPSAAGKIKAKYMGLYTVNTARQKQQAEPSPTHSDTFDKYMPPATFYPTDLQVDSKLHKFTLERPGSCLFITEGELKAMAVHYFFKESVVGVRGVKDYANDEVKRFILDSRQKTIIVATDRDYKSNAAVAVSVFKLLEFISSLGLQAYVLNWKHPSKQLDISLKGVDDAILLDNRVGGVVYSRMDIKEFYNTMHANAKQVVSSTVVKPGMVFPEKSIDDMQFVVKDTTHFNIEPDKIYQRSEGPEVYARAIAENRLVVDISPTGTGKSYRAGIVELAKFKKDWLAQKCKKNPMLLQKNQMALDFMDAASTDISPELTKELETFTPKRFKMLELSPMNNTVSSLKDPRWNVVRGRTDKGWTFDPKIKKYKHANQGDTVLIPPNCPQTSAIIKLRENRQVTEIRKDICMKCPLKNDCAYLNDKANSKKSTYSRMNIASFNPQQGDVVFCDDWGSLEHFIEIPITRTDVMRLYELLRNKPRWKNASTDVQIFVEKVLGRSKLLGLTGKDIFNEMAEEGGDIYPISSWLNLPEPDAINKQYIKVREEGISYDEDDTVCIGDVKRMFFMLLEVFTGKSFGDIYYKGVVNKEDTWIIKGVDPRYKDILSKVGGFVIFDATADIEMLTRIFGQKPLIISAQASPLENIEVNVMKGFANTYKSVIKKAKGKDALLEKFTWISNYQKEHPEEKIGILTYKEVVQDSQIRDLFLPETVWGYWWNDERASNAFYDAKVTTLFTVGVPIPNLASAASEVDKGGDFNRSVLVARPYGPVEDGVQNFIICKDSEDEAVRHNIWYKRSAAMIQATGRLRSVQQPDKQFKLFIMDDIPVPFPVDNIVYVDKQAKEKAFSSISAVDHLKNRQVAFINHEKSIIQDAIDHGFDGLSEDAREFLLTKHAFKIDFVYRYLPEAKRFFTFAEILVFMDKRIAKVLQEKSTLYPECFEEVVVANIDSPEFTKLEEMQEIGTGGS